MGVGDARDRGLLDDHRCETGDLLGHEHALLEAAVGQLEAGDDVADGVDALEVGAAALVGEHEPALHGDPLLGVPQPVGGGATADGHEQQLGLDHGGLALGVLDGDGDAGVGVLHGAEPGGGPEADAALAEGPLQRLGGGRVLGGDQAGQCLHDRDVGAEGSPHAGELRTDDTPAEHDDGGGHALQAQRVLGGQDLLPVDLQAGQRPGVGAGGQHEVGAGVGGAVDGDLAGPGHRAGALDDGDPAPLHQAGEALEEPRDHAVLVGVDAGHVDALERGADAEALRVARGVGDLGGVQQRLGGDAADVQAGAAHLVLLHQADLEAELGGAQGTGVAARPGTEDEHVEVGVSGSVSGVGHHGPLRRGVRVTPRGSAVHLCTTATTVHTCPRVGRADWGHGNARPLPS